MKMTLNLSPAYGLQPTVIDLHGSIITVNAVEYDLSELPDGAIADHPVLGMVKRSGDSYELTITLTHALRAPHETRFPEPLTLVDHSGPVPLPPYDAPTDEDEEVANELAE